MSLVKGSRMKDIKFTAWEVCTGGVIPPQELRFFHCLILVIRFQHSIICNK